MLSPDEVFSGEMRAFLARNRKSSADLARLLGVSEDTVSRRLHQNARWPLDQAFVASQWAGISFDSLNFNDSKAESA
jgi:plasmid maintenance system antidote protein VapI